ncbi:MAG TPA: hypothetical protein PKA82_09250 [Pyrinomonadaceae bacterium]|nr:hypothetical protein [Pyrinomonadaceae bacterium]
MLQTPVQNIVESIDVSPSDALLPLYECIGNSIISLQKVKSPLSEKWISVHIQRGESLDQGSLIDEVNTIQSIVIRDNGIGFTRDEYISFQMPYTKINKQYGCMGMGRFSVIAIFDRMDISSTFEEDGKWYRRAFTFDALNEDKNHELSEPENTERVTEIKLSGWLREDIRDKTAKSLDEISRQVMNQFLIYYLNGELPAITIHDSDEDAPANLNILFKEVSKERERDFMLGGHSFKAYITKTPKKGSRRIHYVHYCANSRVVGSGRDLSKISTLFSYPISENGTNYCLNTFVVSDYLNRKVYKTRNGFFIPPRKEVIYTEDENLEPSFQEIDSAVSKLLEDEYSEFVKETVEKSVAELKEYIRKKAPRYSSFLQNESVLKSIPANLTDEKKDEFLHKIAFRERKRVEDKLDDIIANRQITEDSIKEIVADLRLRSSHDKDSLAEYLMRRRAIIELFEKFLEADVEGKYKLEEDIHNLIFPMGLSADEVNYDTHNLWLLDERFVTYSYIGSDKTIGSISGKRSSIKPDITVVDENMFDTPISFGDKPHGEISSLVIFEFKRPGEVAHQKGKSDYRWDFAELTDKYFEAFIYAPDKVKHKGRPVVVTHTTPKFGYIIVDVIPPQLSEYNTTLKGWKKTPFGTYFRINPDTNLHLEVITFEKLVKFAKDRPLPFFNKLFST